MNAEQTIRNLAIIRILIGVGAWLAPNLAGRLFGLDPANNPQAAFLGRLFGVRDIALGLGTLQASGEARRQWLQLGVLCDSADAAAAVLGRRGGYLSPASAVMAGGVATVATGLGVQALQAPDA
jgi:hypothetical protein